MLAEGDEVGNQEQAKGDGKANTDLCTCANGVDGSVAGGGINKGAIGIEEFGGVGSKVRMQRELLERVPLEYMLKFQYSSVVKLK